MIYSVHDQVRGDFAYWDSPNSLAINDDHPVPRFDSSLVFPVGIAASDAGRPLPPGSTFVGRGPFPKGKVSTGKLGTEQRGTFMGPNPDGTAGIGEWSEGQINTANWVAVVVASVIGFAVTYTIISRGER